MKIYSLTELMDELAKESDLSINELWHKLCSGEEISKEIVKGVFERFGLKEKNKATLLGQDP